MINIFCDLHVHTKYSLLDSNVEPKELIEKIVEQGKSAICITEHGNLYSSIEIYKLCKENGIKYLHGCEMYICNDVKVNDKDNRYHHLILISKNEIGRLNLIKLVSLSNNYKYYGKPRIDFEMLMEYKEGLIVLSGCMAGAVQRNLMNGDYDKSKSEAIKYQNAFGEDYYLEYQSHSEETQQELNRKIVDLANELKIKYVVTTDSHYIAKEMQKYHNIFVQIGQSREVGETYNDCYIQSEDEVLQICQSTTQEENLIALKNTEEIAEKCNVIIPLSDPIMQHFEIPDGFKSEIDYLKHLCIKGWKNRKIDLADVDEKKKYKNRLAYEISAIEEMGFEGYYLNVWDYANSVKRRGIARGSGGGSLVAYLINIVDTDPIKYGLYFERFIDVGALELLKEGKITKAQLKTPDFDLDFGREDREKVLQSVIEKHGIDKIASLGSFQYMWAKGAIKDIGKVLDIPFVTTNEMTSKLDGETIQEVLELGLLKQYEKDYPELFTYADKLAGLPKAFSVHPCFPKDTAVLTYNGYKGIQNVDVGDKVLTHLGNYKLVAKTMKNKTSSITQINACGTLPIRCTDNHPFYIRHRIKNREKLYDEPIWINAEDIIKSDMICLPINSEEIVPEYGNLEMKNENFWWIIGRYMGDGWCEYHEKPRNEKKIIICCNKSNDVELNEILARTNLVFDTRFIEENTTYKIFIKNNDLFEYLQRFGKYAHKKHLTDDIFNLPMNLLTIFIEGYLSADGSISYDDFHGFKTVSKDLANGMIQCVAKAFHRHCNVHTISEKVDIIEGRKVNAKEKYYISFSKHLRKKERNYYDNINHCLWLYVKNVTSNVIQEETVYNLSVIDDNTYTVNNIAVHNCGKVICEQPVEYYNATEISKSGEIVLQGDMHTAEDLGLIKADFLGLRTVDIIYDVLDMIGKDYDYIAPHNINFEDERVLNNFRNGNTAGIFQFESDGMKATLRNISCGSLYDLTVANALYRPGSMAFIDNYARRKNRTEEYEYLHSDLIPILKDSFAIIVFQEQLIEIGRLANLNNPDELRQATAKKKPKLMAKIEPELKNGLVNRGWSQEQVDTLWDTILAFAKYSFNKSHALAYAMIAYICMYLKTYHPKEFVCAWVNSYGGKTEKLPVCYAESQRIGVPIHDAKFGESKSTAQVYKNGVMVGTQTIKFCNAQIANELMELSKNKYKSFIDLIIDIKTKTSLDSRQLTILTGLNFFSQFGKTQYLLNMIDVYNKFHNAQKEQIKQIKINDLQNYGLSEYIMEKYSGKKTVALYKELDVTGLIKELCAKLENKAMGIIETFKFELEYLGYNTYINPTVSEEYYIVIDFKHFKDVLKPYLLLRNIKTGEEIKTRIKQGKVFKQNPFGCFSILKIKNFSEQFKRRNISGGWIVSDETELILDEWETIK